MSELGERIKEAREALGISQGELERRAKLSQGYVTRLEKEPRRGKRMGEPTMHALANALEVRFEWLARGEEPRALGERTVEYDRRYDAIVHEAVWLFGQRGKRVRSEAVELARAEMANANPTVEQLIERIEQKEHDLRAAEKGKLIPPTIDTSEDDSPPGLRPKVKSPRKG